MQCPQCQHENREGAKFCAGCGSSLAITCASCGIIAWLSEAYLLAGRMQDATDHALHALDHASTHKQRGFQAWALRLLGDIALHHDSPDIDQAETHYRQALATELGIRSLQAYCHRGLGTLYSQTGQSEQARAELSTAIEMYRDMEMMFWLPETKAALADVKGRS